ncbi:MAG: RNA polymerase sigma factor [Actinomycetota bacterium]
MSGQEPDVAPGTAALDAPREASDSPALVEVTDASVDAIDDGRFDELFRSSYRPLVAYARRRTADAAAADDVVAETFATAWRRRAERDAERAALPWLYGIAANVVRNHWRSDRRHLRLVDRLESEPVTGGVGPVPGVDGDPDLHTALSRLSFDDQEVLRLITWEELSHAEAAEALDCSVNAVGIRLHRARQRLRDQLESISSTSSHDASDPPRGRGTPQ